MGTVVIAYLVVLMNASAISSRPPRWELAAENIAVKIRWIGVLVGYLSVTLDGAAPQRTALNAMLALGAVFTLFDTWYSLRGQVFLGRYPLAVSVMEAVFIGLLCHLHTGLDSAFRYFYFLSLICCALRYSSRVTLATCLCHYASITAVYFLLPAAQRDAVGLALMLVILGWFTWAASALGHLLRKIGDHLSALNSALRENQTQLELRIAERSRELQEAQAHVLHQEKMAAFGLLAAGIAHEVGNPLTAISSIVQLLERRDLDAHTRARLALVGGQLQRIQGTLRELIEFSRPASTERIWVKVREILDEALGIAKYYKGTKSRRIEVDVPADAPALFAVRDQLVQVFLNLILNAVDATDKSGRIDIRAEADGSWLCIAVRDDGVGIAADQAPRLFQPYFTTKKHGTGLGLFVTRQLVVEHGGDVSFVSTPGAGTKFLVRVPLGDVRAPEPAASVDVLSVRSLPAPAV